jgi:hypothetical protein
MRISPQSIGPQATPTISGLSRQVVVNVRDSGALGDVLFLSDAAMTAASAVFTSASASFTSADVGKRIAVVGAGAAGVTLWVSIASVQSATSITLSATASTTVSGAVAAYGTDDTAAFQNTLTVLGLRGHGTLHTPEGSYFISTGLVPPNNIRMVGAGMYGSVLVGTPACTDSVIQRHPTTTLPTSTSAPMTGVHMSDFAIDGSLMPTSEPWGGGKGLFFQWLQDCSFARMFIHDTPASCFGNDYQRRVNYHACHAVNSGRGAPVGTGSYPGGNGFGFGTGGWADESWYCSDCWAEGCFYGGYVAEAVNNANLSKYMEFHNCRASGNQFGFRFEGPGTAATGTGWAKLIGCSAVSNTKDGIGVSAGCPEIIIADAICELNGTNGIYIDNPASYGVDIHDCTVNNNSNHGIWATCGYLQAHHNRVFANGHYGILSDSYNSKGRITIDFNHVYNNGQLGGTNDGIRVTPNAAITEVRLQGNRCFDDQGTKTQRYGIITTGANLDYLYIIDNDLAGNLTGALLHTSTGTHDVIRGNMGYNPVGVLGPPVVPATTVALLNPYSVDCTVYIQPNGATISAISIAGTATGATSGAFRVPAGQTITLAYTVATPSWVWIGD